MRFILFFTIFFFFSCNLSKKEKDNKESDSFEELISVEESIDKNAINGSMIIFCKSDNPNKIGYGSVHGVLKTYLNDPMYNQQDYKPFISNLINFKSTFVCDDIMQCFNINDTIKKIYDKNNFPAFLLKYSRNNTIDKNEYIISNDISFNSQLSVIYYLYLNHYYTVFDDLSGFYFSRRIDDFSDKLVNLNLEDWK